MMKHIYFFFALFFCGSNFTSAQPGTPDPSFGSNGIVKTDFNLSKLNSKGKTVLVQPDGSLLVLVESENGVASLAKILPDGLPDLTYGTFGYSFPLFITGAVAATQADGKVIIAGTSEVRNYTSFGESDLLVARVNTDGSLDNSFNADGLLTTSFGMMDQAKSVTVLPNGRIIVIGLADDHLFSVSALNSDGNFDDTFNTNGKYTYSIEGYDGAAVQDDSKIVLTNYSFALNGYYTFRLNTDGTNDVTFNSTTFDQIGIRSISIQDDGKILVAGYTQVDPSAFFLERFNTDGTPDTDFGTNGNVTTDFSAGASVPTSLMIANDGKILITGYTIVSATEYIYSVARYETDGSPDNSFSGDGMLSTPLGNGAFSIFTTSEQSDQKLLVAYTDNDNFALTRFNSDGTPDNTFSQDAVVNDGIEMGSTFYLSSAIQTDGKLVTAGFTFNGINNDFALARYNPDGSLDAAFSNDGKQVEDINSSNDTAYAVVIQNDGKIIAAGSAIARYGIDGIPDAGFGNNGKISSGNWKSAALQSDGKLIVAGEGVARYNTDGSPDMSFGNGGTVGGGRWYAVAIQTDGKIVVAGGTDNFEIARYNSDGTPDNSFSGDGFESTHIYEDPNAPEDFYAGHARAVVIQGDDKIVIAGDWHYNYRDYTSFFALVRYNADGSLDDSFSQDGILLSVRGFATSLAIQSDGKIVAGGSSNDEYQFADNVYSDFKIVRYNTDGSLDPDFNGDGVQVTPLGSPYTIAQSLNIFNDVLYATGHGIFPNNLGIVVRYQLDAAGGPVPLTLVSFDARLKNDSRLVTWVTHNEYNVNRYEIERSTNPLTGFAKIYSVNAFNENTNNYSYADYDILQENFSYYRLKIYDDDGKISYSRIVRINNIHDRYIIAIYPNPAKDYINILPPGNVQRAAINIYNSIGKKVMQRVNVSGQNFQLDISSLPKGVYSIQLVEGDRVSISKFIK